MINETKAQFNHIVFDDNGSFEQLFVADFTYINRELADYYQLPNLPQNDFAMVPYGNNRSGILSHGSILTTYSHDDQTSPILRGMFVRDRILCQELALPPADLEIVVPEVDGKLSTRERFAAHTDNPNCSGCHQFIDPLGFGFEHFDEAGRYRSQENGRSVDASGVLVNPDELYRTPRQEYGFSGIKELGQIIGESQQAKRCFAVQFYRYTIGRKGNDSISCQVSSRQKSFIEGEQSIRSMMLQFTQSKYFAVRQ